MSVQSRDPSKKFRQASRVEFLVFLIIVLVTTFDQHSSVLNTPVVLLVIMLLLCVISGYLALQYRKLPKSRKNHYSSFFSEFSVHPYLTFGIFLVLSIICGLITFSQHV